MSQWTRAVASIDLAAIRSNVAELVRRNPGAEVMAMVKADAYGHGATQVARAAQQGGAGWLGVAYASEALALRRDGVEGRILALVVNPGEDLDPVIGQGIDISVSAPWAVEAAAAAARTTGKTASVHLEVDTGMTRGGARPDTWPALVAATKTAVAAGDITLTGIWTHLVHDDPHDPVMDLQARLFQRAVEVAAEVGLTPAYSHISKSTTALARPDLARDLVRAGLAVYGLSPTGIADPGLKPAMTFKARVALAGHVGAGMGIGYSHRHVTAEPTRVALVPVGYADGVPRDGSGILEVLVGGRRRQVAGAISMDQFTIETGDDAVTEGDEVLLFGPGSNGEPTAQEWADATGTISWEIVTRVGARVPRIYP